MSSFTCDSGGTEIKFLVMNLTKYLVFCSMLFTVSSTGGIYRKPRNQKNPQKKKTRVYHEKHFLVQKNEVRKSDKSFSLRRLKLVRRNLDKNCRSTIPSQDYSAHTIVKKCLYINQPPLNCPAPLSNACCLTPSNFSLKVHKHEIILNFFFYLNQILICPS
jgi:hypothetical protein